MTDLIVPLETELVDSPLGGVLHEDLIVLGDFEAFELDPCDVSFYVAGYNPIIYLSAGYNPIIVGLEGSC